jgi:tRNA threonylcarbamoyl adenosine modification protein YeaZ
MGLTLGIDTSATVAAGLARDGQVLASLAVDDTRKHVEELIPLVEKALAAAGASFAELGEVAVGVGPGPFTGLRVGVAAAQTIAAALGIPVKGVCSLDVLARQSGLTGDFTTANDARRHELYWAIFRDGARVAGPFVTRPEELPPLPRFGLTGVDAGLLAAVAASLPDAGLEPLYLRRPDAQEPAKAKSALPRLAVRRR